MQAILREEGEPAGVCVRDDTHGALGLGAHQVVVADHDPTLEAGSRLQPRRPEPKPLGEEPQKGATFGSGVRVPLEELEEKPAAMSPVENQKAT